MKNLGIIPVILFISCHTMEKNSFKGTRVSQSASIILNGNIQSVFPLFGAFEERNWADGWEPMLIYPEHEVMEEGTTFRTKAHNTGHGEEYYTWTVSKYQPEDHLVQYLVMTANRFWTINVQCAAKDTLHTTATVTYSYTGLNENGNQLNKAALEKMYRHQLKDWEKAVNHYLAHGELLKEN